MLKRNRLDHTEEFNVLGIRPRPSTLDEMYAQLIKFLGDTHLVLGRKTDILGLRAVPQCRVVDFQMGNHTLSARSVRRCLGGSEPSGTGIRFLLRTRHE